MTEFRRVLINTMVANVTTSYLWFALVFWAYLETKSVLATGIIGGSYMLLMAVFGLIFGTYIDRHKKKHAMVVSGTVTLISLLLAGIVFLLVGEQQLANMASPLFWLFVVVILVGSVIENMRNIALSTTVTLLVPKKDHDKANGMVGTVQGIAFIVTSAISGLSIGFLGLGWTLAIAMVLTALAYLHLIFYVDIPEPKLIHDQSLDSKKIDVRGAINAIKSVPGLLALIILSTFNNLIGGVYMALMDPYGLTLFSVEKWGMIFALAGTGFIIGGLLIAKFGLGKNPLRTLLYTLIVMGFLGAIFTIREWAWLYIIGIWLYMTVIPFTEAAEQTIVQRVVPLKQQGRVFGFAQSAEAAAAPITAFLIAPLAEFLIIPYAKSDAGQAALAPLMGYGQVRGIGLVFLVSGIIMMLAAVVAFRSNFYRLLSDTYRSK